MPPTKAQIVKIHTLKGALQLDDDTYRAALGEYGVKSSTKLSAAKADQLIRDLEDKATAAGVWERRAGKRAQKVKLADGDQARKIRQLWLELHDLGKVANPSELALLSYVKRMTRVDRLEWLDVKQSSTVIEALKKWLKRPSDKSEKSDPSDKTGTNR